MLLLPTDDRLRDSLFPSGGEFSGAKGVYSGDRLDSLKYFGSRINLKVLLDYIKCLKQGLKSLRGFVRRSNNPNPLDSQLLGASIVYDNTSRGPHSFII